MITYATYSIRAEIRKFIVKNRCIVKVVTTKDHRNLFFKLRSATNGSRCFKWHEIGKLAEELHIDCAAVVEMESRMTSLDRSFDTPPGQSEDSAEFSPAETLFLDKDDPSVYVEKASPDLKVHREFCRELMALDTRSR